MTKRISCTKLSKVLEAFGIEMTAQQLRGSCEAYGRNVQCYINAGSPEKRVELENYLTAEGCKVDRRYYPGSGKVEVAVSYFKASHWDE